MTAIVEPRPADASVEGDRRFLVRGAGWRAYDALAEALSDRRVPRMTYDRGDLEFMSPSPEHEELAGWLGAVVRGAAREYGVPIKGLGSTTFRSEALDRGLEPDRCFYTVNWRRVVRKKRLDLGVDPPPDLAIEIDITSSSLNRLAIDAALRVPEVWRCDGTSVDVLLLGPDGLYGAADGSPTFPRLPLGDVLTFIEQTRDLDDNAWEDAFRAWLRDRAR